MPAADAPVVLAIDAGTTGVRALLVDAAGHVVAERYRETLPAHPGPGLVEHDLDALWGAVGGVIADALRGHDAGHVAGLGTRW